LIFKNNKSDTKLNTNYVFGLSKALGLNLKKEAFSMDNLSNREHLNMLKEKLAFQFWRKIADENRDLQVKSEPTE
jgi:hypothetical protein